MICRGCGADASRVLCDLGAVPLANQLLTVRDLAGPETRYPLAPLICPDCRLVQLPELVAPGDIFTGDYPYFSSQSAAFVAHAGRYAKDVIERFALSEDSLVVEIASNDGYLLEHFARAGIRCYGVEPAANVALHALRRGVPTLIEFFDATLVCERLLDLGEGDHIEGGEADLIVANNVLAHVPDLAPFLHGVRLLLAGEGVFSVEVPWLVDLVDGVEVGTIYHEHYSYFLLGSLTRALAAHGLRVFDAQRLAVHGGSLRVYACHEDSRTHPLRPSVAGLHGIEARWLAGGALDRFAEQAGVLKRSVWAFLAAERQRGHTVAGYCAAAKGATVLAWCGVGPDEVAFVADTTPAKQGYYLAGSRIPVADPQRLQADRPDVIWILAPNWARDIVPRLLAQCPWRPEIAWQDATGIVRVGGRELAARAAA